MTAAWPAAKISPYPLNDDYGHIFGEPRTRTELEQGASRQRRVFRTAKTQLLMSWMFTGAQFEIFRAFEQWSISGGADPFTMDVWTGSAYENLTVAFVKGTRDTKRADGEWKVTATLETGELPVMSSDTLDGLIGAAGSGLPSWPSSYIDPYAGNDDLDANFPDSVIRSDFEDGYSAQVRPFVAAPMLYTASIHMTNAQYDAFRAWRQYRIAGGDGWFTMSVFRGNSNEANTVRIVKGQLSSKRFGPDWMVRMQLELRDLAPSAASVLS